MYSDITNIFLDSVKALRFYVNSVETNLVLDCRQASSIDDSEIFGMLMYMAMRVKEHNIDIGKLEVEKEFPEEVAGKIKELIVGMGQFIQEKEVDGKKVYEYQAVPREIKKHYQKYKIQEQQAKILYSGSLMLLITYFENLVAGVIKKDFVKHPQRVDLDSKSISYKVLTEVNSVENIRNMLIDQEVTSKMYQSVSDWKKFFQRELKLELKDWDDNFGTLQEIIARRNLYVHNNGIVNEIYVNLVGKEKRSLVGENIGIERKYIDNALDMIEYLGISLAIEAWVKEYANCDDEMKRVTDMIFEEYLITERWEIAKRFYAICLQSRKLCDADAMLCQINYWLCCKSLGQYDMIQEEITKKDLSAYSPKFVLGVLALQDNYTRFFEIYDEQNEIKEEHLREWPLFISLRESDEYRNRFHDEEN